MAGCYHQPSLLWKLSRDVESLIIDSLRNYASVYFLPGTFRRSEAHRPAPSPHRASNLAGETGLLRETNYLGVIKETITNSGLFHGGKSQGRVREENRGETETRLGG